MNQILSVTNESDGRLMFQASVPLCKLTAVGGSAMMLAVNGLTWWRMWKAYLKLKAKRQDKLKAR